MTFWLVLVTSAAAAAASLSPEANVPLAALVTWFSNHHMLTLWGSSAAFFAMTRDISQTLER
jgi:hypothetical protein